MSKLYTVVAVFLQRSSQELRTQTVRTYRPDEKVKIRASASLRDSP
jgi:hypothetical protein